MENFGLFFINLPTPVLTALFTVAIPSLNSTAAAPLLNPAWPLATNISNNSGDSEWPILFIQVKGNWSSRSQVGGKAEWLTKDTFRAEPVGEIDSAL